MPEPNQPAAWNAQEEPNPVLDVHPPHEPIHGWRDFLLHILTITIGLLIALSLEGLVEYTHHRHIVHEAHENIHKEIELNHAVAQTDLHALQEAMVRVRGNIVTLQQTFADPKHSHGDLHIGMSFSSFNDSAWRSSRDMGALTYMPYQEVQGYADVYGQQDLVKAQAIDIFTHQAYSATPLFLNENLNQLSPADFQTLLHESAHTLVGLTGLSQMLQQLDDQYVAVLKQP